MENLDSIIAWLEEPFVQRLLYIVLGIAFIITISYFIKKGLNRTLKSVDAKYRARKAVNFIAYFFMVLVLLFVYRDKLGSVGMALGLAGAGIAFALQEVIVSIAGWLNIILGGKLSVGQRVKIGDVKGDIIDIGVMTTTIMEVGDWIDGDLFNGRIVSIANSYVYKEKVHNYSAEYPFLWDEVTVPIRTESNYKLAKEVFTQVLHDICGEYANKSEAMWNKLAYKFRVEEAQVQPMVTLRFDENWITFTLRYIVDYKKRRSTKDLIYTRLLDELAQHDDIMIATNTIESTTITETEGQ